MVSVAPEEDEAAVEGVDDGEDECVTELVAEEEPWEDDPVPLGVEVCEEHPCTGDDPVVPLQDEKLIVLRPTVFELTATAGPSLSDIDGSGMVDGMADGSRRRTGKPLVLATLRQNVAEAGMSSAYTATMLDTSEAVAA
jgi:hypothetical protein